MTLKQARQTPGPRAKSGPHFRTENVQRKTNFTAAISGVQAKYLQANSNRHKMWAIKEQFVPKSKRHILHLLCTKLFIHLGYCGSIHQYFFQPFYTISTTRHVLTVNSYSKVSLWEVMQNQSLLTLNSFMK